MLEAALPSLKPLLATPELAELGPKARPAAQPLATLNGTLDQVFQETKLPPAMQPIIRALILLWHDHLEASHTISQGIEDSDGSLVHAIMHRREPDYWNSKYWWRRVGQHPCFPDLARQVTEFLKARSHHDLAGKLVPRGEWDAFAFVDACEAAAVLPASDQQVGLLREIQRLETEVALQHFLRAEPR